MSDSVQKGSAWVQLIVGISVFFAIALVFHLLQIKKRQEGNRAKALANAKSIAAALMSFKSEYGAYPCDGTRKTLEADGHDYRPPGNDANAYLAQLVASAMIDSETAFQIPGGIIAEAKYGDSIMGSAEKLLEVGENHFACIMAPNGRPLTDTSSFTPLILATIKSPGPEPIFDGGPYGNMFIKGLADGSSETGDLDENGHAISKGRDSFIQSGPGSLFGKDTPVLKYPLGLQ